MRSGMCLVRHGLLVVAIVASWLLAGADSRAEDGFLAVADDLPLMAGLIENVQAGLLYDKPSGRIVEAYASGALSAYDVVRFYASTMPELGWRRQGAVATNDLQFEREGERLTIEVRELAGTVTVRYSLAPR